MILDMQTLFSDKQAITATGPSTNVVDLGATGTVPHSASALVRNVGRGTNIPLLVQVTEAFTNLTSLTVAIQQAADEAFTSPTTLTTQTIVLADLKPGRRFAHRVVPDGTSGRYLRLLYTVTGTAPTAGRITAGMTMGNDETYPVPL